MRLFGVAFFLFLGEMGLMGEMGDDKTNKSIRTIGLLGHLSLFVTILMVFQS